MPVRPALIALVFFLVCGPIVCCLQNEKSEVAQLQAPVQEQWSTETQPESADDLDSDPFGESVNKSLSGMRQVLVAEKIEKRELSKAKAELASDQSWKVKLTKEFTKSVDELEEYYAENFAGNENWTSAKRVVMTRRYHNKMRSQKIQFDLPCKVVNLTKANLTHLTYKVHLSLEGAEDLELLLRPQNNSSSTATIRNISRDIGEEVSLSCICSVFPDLGPSPIGFSEEMARDFRRGRSKVGFKLSGAGALDTGINKDGRNYYFGIEAYDIFAPNLPKTNFQYYRNRNFDRENTKETGPPVQLRRYPIINSNL